MRTAIANLVINFVVFGVAVKFVPGVYAKNIGKVGTAALTYAVLMVFAKPIMVFLTLPITFLTLGLFILVIDIGIVLFTSFIVSGFRVDGLKPAFLLVVVTSIATFLTKIFL